MVLQAVKKPEIVSSYSSPSPCQANLSPMLFICPPRLKNYHKSFCYFIDWPGYHLNICWILMCGYPSMIGENVHIYGIQITGRCIYQSNIYYTPQANQTPSPLHHPNSLPKFLPWAPRQTVFTLFCFLIICPPPPAESAGVGNYVKAEFCFILFHHAYEREN